MYRVCRSCCQVEPSLRPAAGRAELNTFVGHGSPLSGTRHRRADLPPAVPSSPGTESSPLPRPGLPSPPPHRVEHEDAEQQVGRRCTGGGRVAAQHDAGSIAVAARRCTGREEQWRSMTQGARRARCCAWLGARRRREHNTHGAMQGQERSHGVR
jgi:hypothetical protein